MIGRVAISIAVVAAGGARALAAEGPAELRPAELYRAGQRDAALEALTARTEDDRKRELEALRRLKDQSDPDSGALVRAALLLHTDRTLAERGKPRPCAANSGEDRAPPTLSRSSWSSRP